ncbi:MAG TPA: CopD family protein [Candidatus Binatia bacterium]
MEHSALHATQLVGVLLTLAAPLLALIVLLPARDVAAFTSTAGRLDDDLLVRTARSTALVAAVGGVACFLNLIVQVAEFEGVTLLAGAEPSLVFRFATATTVGRLTVTRGSLLLLAAALAWWLSRDVERARRRVVWLPLLAVGIGAAVTTALVTHAAAQPTGREGAIALHFLHVVAAASWLGVLGHLFLTRRALLGATDAEQVRLVAAIVGRFSPMALTAGLALLVTGSVATWLYLGTPTAVLTSAYGLTLATKLGLLVPLVAGGFVNYRYVRPALLRLAEPSATGPLTTGAPPEVLRRLVRTIELEVSVGLVLVITAGILASVSPPTPQGEGRLTEAQTAAILEPRMPRTDIVDPSTWVGSATRTEDDLKYSEFMHQWSGALVILLGLAWLVQSVGGDSLAARIAAWVWPAAFVPFAVFVAIASDPEVWPLGTVSPLVALTDPIVLEHRVGALMIVVLAWLGLREARRGGPHRPLGHALPIVMVVGSLLLLGHAHSSFSASDSLTTLINVQHAVLGGLGVLAGMVRWLQLRQLVPQRLAAFLWPTLVLAIGLFMTLSYRELV